MTSTARGHVELKLAADGTVIDSWESFSLRESFTDPLGDYQFTIAALPKEKRAEYRDKLRKGERVTISIDGHQQAVCLITTQTQDIGENGYTIQIEAKSLLATAFEASVDPYLAQQFQNDTPLTEVVAKVMKNFGFSPAPGGKFVAATGTADVTAISGKNLQGRADPIKLDGLSLRDVRANQNETAYSFCSRLFTRYGLALRVTSDGFLLLSAPDYQQAPAYVVVETKAQEMPGDRFLRQPGIQIRDTNESQFSELIVAGKSPDPRGTTSAAQPIAGVAVADIQRPADAPFVLANMKLLKRGRHSYRGPWKPKYRVDKKSRDHEICKRFALLLHGIRAANAFTVRGTVDGVRSKSGGRIWAVDTVARVIVDEAGIDEPMWLLERQMQVNRGAGQTTTLTFIPLGSLLLGDPEAA